MVCQGLTSSVTFFINSKSKRLPQESHFTQATVETSKNKSVASGGGVAFSAAVMAAGTMMSRVLGLFRDIVITATFDRTVTDAWLVAFRLPNLFRRMLGEGSFSISFIPVFVELTAREGGLHENGRSRDLLNGMFSLLFLLLSALTILGVIFSDEILHYLVPGEGYMSIPGKFQLTVYMAKVMFSFIFFISIYAYYMAVLNSFKRFAVAAFAPALFNAVLIVAAFSPIETKIPGDVLTWAVLIGVFLEMAILIPSLIKINALPAFKWKMWSPDISRVFHGLVPSWIGVGILQLTALINVRLGSELPEGTHSWIYLADRILELPLSLVAVSLSSALLPTLSHLWAEGRKEEMISTSQRYLKLTLFLSLPAAVGVYALAEPIVRALFEHGKFSQKDVEVTSDLLRIYSIAILSYGGIRVIVSPFYAIKNTWIPAVVSGICLVFHYFLASYLVRDWGVRGITSSSVASSVLNLTLLVILHSQWIGPFHLFDFSKSIAKYVVAAFVMTLILETYWPLKEFLYNFSRIESLSIQISLTLVVLTGAATYFVVSYLVKAEGMDEIIPKIRRRLKI